MMARDVPSPSAPSAGSVIPNLAAAKELWTLWEVHILILTSLFLQFFLFFFAGMRRRSSSSILRGVLWLAYLSADSVAIFVLGHLMVHAEGPRHHLIYFWAPFVLVHLGGQDTITAFSRQDNELWRRHLLNLVTQVAMAGYVVAKASWPDSRLWAATVIMFLSGCSKYGERTYCLYDACPQRLNLNYVNILKGRLQDISGRGFESSYYIEFVKKITIKKLDMMSTGDTDHVIEMLEIFRQDDPRSMSENILVSDDISGMLVEFKSRADCCAVYTFVEACLVQAYESLYTKADEREGFYKVIVNAADSLSTEYLAAFLNSYGFVLRVVFQYVSAPIALVLFIAAEKGQHQTSTADTKVSYALLVGAIFLDVCSFFSSLRYLPRGRVRSAVLQVANYIRRTAWSRKQWSEELAQYNIIRIKVLESGWPYYKRLAAQLFGLGIITQTKCDTPLKEMVLNNLLEFGARKEWDVTSSRGKLALKKWIDDNHRDLDTSTQAKGRKALEDSITLDFPISVLIWHIATEMCYFCGDNATTSNTDELVDRDKQVSRELSNYMMYLVFKCGVTRTPSSQLLHNRADDEIKNIISKKHLEGAVRELFDHEEEEEVTLIQKQTEQANDSNLQKLVQKTLEVVDSPVVPRAREVARELIGIKDTVERWHLIVEVWMEMLNYAAPRCGSAFHYEHLSTGGEFVTHVLTLIWLLGPFLPPPGA